MWSFNLTTHSPVISDAELDFGEIVLRLWARSKSWDRSISSNWQKADLHVGFCNLVPITCVFWTVYVPGPISLDRLWTLLTLCSESSLSWWGERKPRLSASVVRDGVSHLGTTHTFSCVFLHEWGWQVWPKLFFNISNFLYSKTFFINIYFILL